MPARIELRLSEFEKLRLPGHCVQCMAETKHTSAARRGTGSKTPAGAIAFPCCESCDRTRKLKRTGSIVGLCLFLIYVGHGFVRGFVAGSSEVDLPELPVWVKYLADLV